MVHLRLVEEIEEAEAEVYEGELVKAEPPPMPSSVKRSRILSRVWEEMIDLLPPEALDALSTMDAFFLEMMLRHFQAARMASDELMESSSVMELDLKNHRMQKHPAEVIFRNQSSAFLAYLKEAGWSPRQRAANAAIEDGNPFLS